MSNGTTGPNFSGGNPRKDPQKIDPLIRDWTSFYENFFGVELCSFSGLEIPPRQFEFERLLVIPKGLRIMRTLSMMRRHLKGSCTWTCTDDLDEAISKNERCPKQHYAVWVSDEAKDPNTSDSGNSGGVCNGRGARTLLEGLIHVSKHYSETRKPLYDEGILVPCAGSSFSNGFVPTLSSANSDFYIYLCTNDQQKSMKQHEVVYR